MPELINISELIQKLNIGVADDFGYSKQGDWDRVRKGNYVSYHRVIELAGAADQVELDFSWPFELLMIAQYFGSTDVKTFNVRMFGMRTPESYIEIDNGTAAAIKSAYFVPDHEFISLMPFKMQFNFSSFTAGELVDIQVVTREV